MLDFFCSEPQQDNRRLNDLLNKVKNEVGIQQLIPYFVQLYNERLVQTPENSFIVLLFYKALINNEAIFIDSYLHDILPAMLTIVVSSVYSNQTASREIVNEILKYIFEKYAGLYKNLGPRIINSLIKNIKSTEKSVDSFSCVDSLCFICTEHKFILETVLREDELSLDVRKYVMDKIK
ncbi:Transcription initiation factor TFIID subunit 6 [Cucumispora dikerogammari]|nr:Transcription initiation factor TFIID subunit 6 [Cucumispora dikerogammari]